ncbi:hypothetical protein JTB14_007898 [Gonioctena quinquepunctata]|nr:hypothetical protein JTB14_007898 [Gonioctena quinquepunctata]
MLPIIEKPVKLEKKTSKRESDINISVQEKVIIKKNLNEMDKGSEFMLVEGTIYVRKSRVDARPTPIRNTSSILPEKLKKTEPSELHKPFEPRKPPKQHKKIEQPKSIKRPRTTGKTKSFEGKKL